MIASFTPARAGTATWSRLTFACGCTTLVVHDGCGDTTVTGALVEPAPCPEHA